MMNTKFLFTFRHRTSYQSYVLFYRSHRQHYVLDNIGLTVMTVIDIDYGVDRIISLCSVS